MRKTIKYPIIVKCLNCGKNIICNNRQELRPKNKERKFCNRSCATSFNNKGRIPTEHQKNKVRESLTNIFYKKVFTNTLSKFHDIKNTRRQARTIMKFFDIKECEHPNCNYSKILEIHHIGGVDNNLNDYKKLVALCPNHHAEISYCNKDDTYLIPIVEKRIEKYKNKINKILQL